jgi:hypothetical protein
LSAAGKLDHLSSVAGEVSDGGIDLPESDLHTFSVKQEWAVRRRGMARRDADSSRVISSIIVLNHQCRLPGTGRWFTFAYGR